jgi:hypothetical protein
MDSQHHSQIVVGSIVDIYWESVVIGGLDGNHQASSMLSQLPYALTELDHAQVMLRQKRVHKGPKFESMNSIVT